MQLIGDNLDEKCTLPALIPKLFVSKFISIGHELAVVEGLVEEGGLQREIF